MKHRNIFLLVLLCLGGITLPFVLGRNGSPTSQNVLAEAPAVQPTHSRELLAPPLPLNAAVSDAIPSEATNPLPSCNLASTTAAPKDAVVQNGTGPESKTPDPEPNSSQASSGEPELSPAVVAQIEALQTEKALRTPVQKRINSDLLLGAKREDPSQKEDATTQNLQTNLKKDSNGRVLVDIKATITEAFSSAVQFAGGEVVNSFPEELSMRAWLPLASIETLASRDEVSFIRPAVPARTHAGKIVSQGDAAHKANLARTTFGLNGSGVKVGVLSDSVDHLSTSQASGELGPVTVLPGQQGSGNGEGTAMLEIVHDLAPGASLYFATADGSPASFANNIKALRNAGCDIIVDDVGYLNEAPFQDDVISRAVNTVTANGALYFSSAGNAGNKRSNHSGTWEGDFVDGGSYSQGGSYHSFGTAKYNTITSARSQAYASLFWSDPLGKSANDYDLYILDSTGQTIVARSDDYQNGTSDPVEFVDQVSAGQRIVVVRSSGQPRFIHVDTGDAELAISTAGNVRGHPAAVDAFCVAAMSIQSAGGGAFLGGLTNPLEYFSSDGPRRVFYNSNGTALTPGNLSSSGGAVRQKPDLTAADGVATSVPGFSPFYGTSAAAPHAAAVAALVKSYKPDLTPALMRKVLISSALDVAPAGTDEASGAGIVMALNAIQYLSPGTGTTGTATPARLTASANSGQFTLKVDGALGQTFQLETSTNLASWSAVGTPVTNVTGSVVLNRPMTEENAFYRLRAN